jgi:uncharacterized membrane protein
MTTPTTYLVTLVLFVSIDLIWLGIIAKNFYRAEIGSLMAEQMSLPAAALFYLIYCAGLMVFVIQPSAAIGGWSRALILGTLFGFVAYATYDLTNLSTLRGWSIKLSVVDMVWGAILSGVTAAAVLAIADRLSGRIAS